MPESKTRGEDMCLGINFCDGMIMTASGSTFSWWMSYLLKSNGPVFYNSQTTDPGTESKDIHDFDLFLPEWIMLSSTKDGKVKKEAQWWHERNGVPPDLP
uniref:Uncharacterized protein n=1 Tax=Panagrolaimus sp. PS1159 TaxID=55785 RepID=A0AC35FTY8_9BILA